MFTTVVSVSALTGPILVTAPNPGLDSIMLIVKFNASATACITSASAQVGGGGVLPVMAYTGRLRPKGVPFSGFRCIKE